MHLQLCLTQAASQKYGQTADKRTMRRSGLMCRKNGKIAIETSGGRSVLQFLSSGLIMLM